MANFIKIWLKNKSNKHNESRKRSFDSLCSQQDYRQTKQHTVALHVRRLSRRLARAKSTDE